MSLKTSWLLLMHQISPKSDSFRVKIWRNLQKLGALQIKNSVYVLPDIGNNKELLEKLVSEISSKNGDAFLCLTQFVAGIENNELIEKFNSDRTKRFDVIASSLKKLRQELNSKKLSENKLMSIEHNLGKTHAQIQEIKQIDYFGCGSSQQIETLYLNILSDLKKLKTGEWSDHIEKRDTEKYANKIWVTRSDVHIDRMASAWFILKFVDKKAQFKFTESNQYKPKSNEVCFDMFNAEFGHVGEKCTFEVLVEAFSITDKRIVGLKQIIHDLDIKDQKYDLPETAGVKVVAEGVIETVKDDLQRIEKAKTLFDGIFQTLKAKK